MRLVAGVLSLALLVACARDDGTTEVRFDTRSGPAVIHAEVARTADEQARGLMGRTELAADRGMLFVWPDAAERRFYMFRTLIPLEVVAIRDRAVTAIHTMQPCPAAVATECPTTVIGVADAALEVNVGTARRLGIDVGTRVSSPALR